MKYSFLIGILLLISFVLPFQVKAQLYISEIQSLNASTLQNEDGEYHDWMELYNYTDTLVDFTSYKLSDSFTDNSFWTFPRGKILPGESIVVFCSGEDHQTGMILWNTIITEGDSWKFWEPKSEMPTNWKTLDYIDSSWTEGQSGFGFGDNDDNTLIDKGSISVFLRKKFEIDNIEDVEAAAFHIDYDDGYVAYLNGKEIARANIGSLSFVSFNSSAESSVEALMIQGKAPEKHVIDGFKDILVEGENILAIQVHNYKAGSSDMSAIPFLFIGYNGSSQSFSTTPILGLKNSYLHANFKIKSEGEGIYLLDKQNNLIDSIGSVSIPENLSYGRLNSDSSVFSLFQTPSPGVKNEAIPFELQFADSLFFSEPPGLFSDTIELSIQSKSPSDTIYYTLDGNDPLGNGIIYTNPITISSTTVVKASIKHNKAKPRIFTSTYILERGFDMPVISLSCPPDYLFNAKYGIYVKFREDWEREVHFEFFDKTLTRQVNQNVGIKIFGAASRGHEQKSLSVFARKVYGKGNLNYNFFNLETFPKYESLVLRNSGNDWESTMFRDGFHSVLASGLNIESQHIQPAVIYINGVYWGILNIREKINEHFIAQKFDIPEETIDLLELFNNKTTVAVNGDPANYLDFINFVKANSLKEYENYMEVVFRMDVKNYIDYYFTQIYLGNLDWPGNNMKHWSINTEIARWRWIMYDTDFGSDVFHDWDGGSGKFNILAHALSPVEQRWSNKPEATLLFRKLMENDQFRDQFINRGADLLNAFFTQDRFNDCLNSFVSHYENEIPIHKIRWGQSFDKWEDDILYMRNFADYRPGLVRNQIKDQFNLPSIQKIELTVNDNERGTVKVNSLDTLSMPWEGYYFENVPISIVACAMPGYKFMRWEGSSTSEQHQLTVDLTSSFSLKAIFEVDNNPQYDLVINEINYKSATILDAGDWIELHNNGSATIDLNGWQISDDKNTMIIQNSDWLLPGDYKVICRNPAQFKKFFMSVPIIKDSLMFGLSSSSDCITLTSPDGSFVDYVAYSSGYPWPEMASGTGATLELVHPDTDNALAENWTAASVNGTPGERNYIPKTGSSSNLKENELVSPIAIYPNPFVESITVNLNLLYSQKVRIELINSMGVKAITLMNDVMVSRDDLLKFSGLSVLPKGVYILCVTVEGKVYHYRIIHN